jgi:hypothetical protein
MHRSKRLRYSDHLVGTDHEGQRTSMPSVLAALRLMTSSNQVGCSNVGGLGAL